MNVLGSTASLSLTYPDARILGRRITRLPERLLDWSVLNAETADELGRNHLGWFVSSHPSMGRVVDKLANLDLAPAGGIWIVVPIGRQHSIDLCNAWPRFGHVDARPTLLSSNWKSNKVWFSIPEDLDRFRDQATHVAEGVAGIILLDPTCFLHESRAGRYSLGNLHRNDRPQHIIKFRASLDRNGWQPPIILLTEKCAMSVNTESVARAFCLNGFWFIRGDTFGCWDGPIDREALTH